MLHARDDYSNIQEITTNGTTRQIPADEPVFLIRGQDAVGGDAVRAWADLAEAKGAGGHILAVARDHAAKMDAWPKKKVADLPAAPSDAGRDHPMPTAAETEAYNDRRAQEREDRIAGGDANRAGRDRGTNPFVGTPARHRMWEQGWDSAERDKADNAHVLLKCIDCGAKCYSTRERVDQYLRPGCTLITCPKCDGGRVEEVADAGWDHGEAGRG